MAITPTYPICLPNVLSSDYSYKKRENVLRTEMEAGAPRMRRRYLHRIVEVNVAWKFSADELATFEKFIEDECYGGAAWFLIPLFNGEGNFYFMARMTEAPNISTEVREFSYKVKATLEVIGMRAEDSYGEFSKETINDWMCFETTFLTSDQCI